MTNPTPTLTSTTPLIEAIERFDAELLELDFGTLGSVEVPLDETRKLEFDRAVAKGVFITSSKEGGILRLIHADRPTLIAAAYRLGDLHTAMVTEHQKQTAEIGKAVAQVQMAVNKLRSWKPAGQAFLEPDRPGLCEPYHETLGRWTPGGEIDNNTEVETPQEELRHVPGPGDITEFDLWEVNIDPNFKCPDHRLNAWVVANKIRFGRSSNGEMTLPDYSTREGACYLYPHVWIINSLANDVGRSPHQVLREILNTQPEMPK